MKKLLLFLVIVLSVNVSTTFAQDDSSENVIIGYKDTEKLVFENDDDLRRWASESKDRAIFIKKLDMIAEKRQFAEKMGYLNNDEATDKYTESLSRDRSSKHSIRNVNPTFALNAIFDNPEYSGSFIPFSNFMPSLLHLNDKGSSIAVIIGGTVLCDNKWFGGKKIWVLGLPGITISNLAAPLWNFDNRASSSFGF